MRFSSIFLSRRISRTLNRPGEGSIQSVARAPARIGHDLSAIPTPSAH
jgi:hypothetical protein